jgi:hypothetical protein
MYQRLARVPASPVSATTTATAITAELVSSSARQHAAVVPAVTAAVRPTPRSRVISGVGRMTRRAAVAAQPVWSRSRAKPSPAVIAPAAPSRIPYSTRAARVPKAGRDVVAGSCGPAQGQQPPEDRPDHHHAGEFGGRADIAETEPGTDHRYGEEHEQAPGGPMP